MSKTTENKNQSVNTRRLKLYEAVIKSIDDAAKTIRFRVSDDSVDRYGEKVEQVWNLKNFNKNPVFLWNHKSGYDLEPEDVLGTWSDFTTEADGSYATAHFDEGNENAMFVFGQYVRGVLKAVSVGFIPHTINWEEDTPVLTDNELLEISAVAIPANANAVALAVKAGEMKRKDALYMLRSMQDGAAALEEQLNKVAPAGEETQMEEVKDTLAGVAKSIEDTTAKLVALDATLDGVMAELAEIKSTVSAPAPAEEEPAKGGKTDQPGAGDEDEVTDESDLTPEQQAEFEAELEKQLKEGDSEE